MTGNAMAGKIIFKKYANRRLYDTEHSKYVTLGAVAERIRAGQQVKIIEAKTKEDVTAFILTQIVLEQARMKNVLLPTPLLHIIIQYGDNVLADFFEKHLQQTIESYIAYKASVDEQFRRWLDVGMDLSKTARNNFAKINPFQSIFEQFTGKAEKEEEK